MLAMTKKSFAFTLAEVLIVLAVLGVIAAMTIPNLIQDANEKATVTQVKKIYTVLNQAFDMAIAENGPIETWDWSSATNAFANIKPYLRVAKECETYKGCWSTSEYQNLHEGGGIYIGGSKALLIDGTALSLGIYGGCRFAWGTSNALKHICGLIHVDINGVSKPNIYGKDVFDFWITPEGAIPAGVPSNTSQTVSKMCNLKSTHFNNGQACAGWIIIKGNMDYLRKEVSWN